MSPGSPSSSAAGVPQPAAHNHEVDGDGATGLSNIEGGETHDKGVWGTVVIGNSAGKARSHIHLTGLWPVPPSVVFQIFTYPDNSALFRDVHAISHRTVTVCQPGYKIVNVEQLYQTKILWTSHTYRTTLKCEEDCRDPDCLYVNFDLLKSDVLSHFNGRWELRPMRDSTGAVTSCAVQLDQDVLPRGIPAFAQHVPMLGSLLRSVCLRSVRRLMEDIDKAIGKVRAGHAQGLTTLDVMRMECGVCEEEEEKKEADTLHAQADVTSFAVDDCQGTSSSSGEESQTLRSATTDKTRTTRRAELPRFETTIP